MVTRRPTIQVPVGKWWMAHPHRREYREITFFPNHDIPGAMNLFLGGNLENGLFTDDGTLAQRFEDVVEKAGGA